jgi:hypothetical protein
MIMTGMKSNIDEVIARFKNFKDGAQNIDYSEALLVGVNAARAKMAFRIFNQALDAQNTTLGKYTGKKISKAVPLTPYELKRVSKGRQVSKKDLEFQGNLRRALRTAKENNTRVICVITNPNLVKISQYLEQQIGKIRGGAVVKIFYLSPEERDFLIKNTAAALKQLYVRAINTK